jgi:ABC-type multidrug transport system ATPase subunit
VLKVPDPRRVADHLLARFGLGRRGRAPVIFLDEPTSGLDPEARIEGWQLIQDLAGSGTTVLLTTQYPEGPKSSPTVATAFLLAGEQHATARRPATG